MMNEGATLDEIIHAVKPPPALAEKPYLRPVYDEPEFVVRNIWRLDGGLYDGVPSHLKPAAESEQAREIAAIAGGVDRVVARANEKLAAGELALACHLIDWAAFAAPNDKAVHEARAKIYTARTAQSSSTMSVGIFSSAARESAEKRASRHRISGGYSEATCTVAATLTRQAVCSRNPLAYLSRLAPAAQAADAGEVLSQRSTLTGREREFAQNCR